jgi:DNA-binding GntR family transcriptional regulator
MHPVVAHRRSPRRFIMPLTKARRVSLAHDVSAQLADAIVAGEFPAGASLQEVALAEKLGVSRAPVREALIELEARGLVQFDEQGRTRVRALSPSDVHDIHALRLALDPLAAQLAAERGTTDDFTAIGRVIDETTSARTLAEIARLDRVFHTRVVEAGKNRWLLDCWSVIGDQMELWLTHMLLRNHAATAKVREATILAHRSLLKAIRSGKPALAAKAGSRHVADWVKSLPAVGRKK